MNSDKPDSVLGGRNMLFHHIIFIGASTGGTDALKELLHHMPANSPPILIVQHMPENFTATFARRLDASSPMQVKEAEHHELIQSGMAYVAPGHSHLSIARDARGYVCCLSRDDPVNRHRPSVDVLFNSAAEVARCTLIAVLLTGMGKDGARGLLQLKRKGAWTITQDCNSCVVYGMPREAVEIGASCQSLPLSQIADAICRRIPGLHHVNLAHENSDTGILK